MHLIVSIMQVDHCRVEKSIIHQSDFVNVRLIVDVTQIIDPAEKDSVGITAIQSHAVDSIQIIKDVCL